ncbi:MAG: DegV family protein [Gemmatimonadales bacterium]
MSPTAIGISYIDGPRLRRSLLAAADWVDAGRDELNRINVFPVPDGDTGTNFAMTLRAAAEAVRGLRDPGLAEVTRAMAEACVFGARGNSGILLSQFLLGFRKALRGRNLARSGEIATALRLGSEHIEQSLDEPVEGTILTVSRDVAEAAERAAYETANLSDMMRHVVERARESLNRTPELLSVLRDNGVVDAGAKAFVRLLEGVVRLIEGEPISEAAEPVAFDLPSAAAMAEVESERDYRFCTEVLVRGKDFPAGTAIRSQLRELGGSIVVLVADDLLKVHVHTDTPEDVFRLAEGWGAVETTKTDDMRAQHRALHETARQIAVVVDSSCDLPDEEIDRHGIVVVPLQVITEDLTYLDRVEIRGAELYGRMRAGDVFTTSQPTPASLARAFEDARSQAAEALGLFISGALSGTLASARAAARASGLEGLTVFDSRTASFGLGLLALRAAELAEQGLPVGSIIQELDRVRDQSGGLFTVDTFENLLRSGRVSRGRAWLGTLLDVKPILEVGREGRIVPLDKVRGRDALMERVLNLLEERLHPKPRSLRIGIVHAGRAEVAEELQTEVVSRFAPRQCFLNEVTAALGVHAGPGAWGIFYQVED